MKWIIHSGVIVCLISVAGCSDSSDSHSAYQRALKAEQERLEASWAAFEGITQEDQLRREAAWAESERADEVYRNMQERSLKLLDIEEALQPRWEALLKRQEEQADRFDALLTKWEQVAAPTPK